MPIHLVAQEDSLIANLNFYIQNLGIPYFGIGNLKWDDKLLSQGVVSISKLTVIFPNGDLVDVPDNGTINTYDLNLSGMNQITLYLHLLKSSSQYNVFSESADEEEKICYSVHNLVLTNEHHLYAGKVSLKLAEFEKDVENRWTLCENYYPPLFTILSHPFLTNRLSTIRTIVESFQKELELESSSGKLFEQRTLNSKLCLLEVVSLRQFILNVDRNVITHPYYLYERLTHFLNTLAIMFLDLNDFSVIPYQHDKLSLLFAKLVELLIQYLKPKTEKLSSIKFEKKQNCYVSERMPQDLYETNEIYLVVQYTDPKVKTAIEGLRMSAHSRLFNVHRFSLTGIVLLRLESAPFNNNFSRQAQVYKIQKDSEWEHALSEGKVAFSVDNDYQELQGFIYWR